MRLRIAAAFLAVFIVACDEGYEATVRNDLDQDVNVKFAFDSGQLVDEGRGPLHPGRLTSVGKVSGPGEHPTILIKAFDLQGNLVFCKRLEYAEYKKTSQSSPLPITPGVTCN